MSLLGHLRGLAKRFRGDSPVPRGRANASYDEAFGFPLTTSFAYDADSLTSQELGAWLPAARSPDAELNYWRDRRVGRIRDLVRNDGWAAGAVNRICDDTIGSLFRLVAQPDWRVLSRYAPTCDLAWAKELSAIIEGEWRTWADDPAHWCDAEQSLSLVQMWRLQLRQKIIDGEHLGVLVWRPETVGRGAARFATTYAMVDTDRLANPYEEPDTHNLRGGVELNDNGAPIAYHIRRAHLYDVFDQDKAVEWDRVPRWTDWGRAVVLHDFDRDRIGQHRGVGLFAPVLAGFRQLSKYDRAELNQALLQTAIGTYVTSPGDPEMVRMAMEAEQGGAPELNAYQALRSAMHSGHPLEAGGVRIPVLPPGDQVTFAPPRHPTANFENFEHAGLRKIAAATGQSAEQVSQDYSKANYSSLRAAMLASWRTMLRRRADFATNTATPTYVSWLEEFFDRNPKLLPSGAPDFVELRAAYGRCHWIGPGRGWVDPVKERQGAVLGLDSAFGTLQNEAAEIGGADWRETLEQRAEEIAEFKRLGIKLPEWAGPANAEQTARKPEPE